MNYLTTIYKCERTLCALMMVKSLVYISFLSINPDQLYLWPDGHHQERSGR